MAIKIILHNGDHIEDSVFCSASTKNNPTGLFPQNLANGWRQLAQNNFEELTAACKTMDKKD